MADSDTDADAAPAVSVPVLIATIESKLAHNTAATARRNAVPDLLQHALDSPRPEPEPEPEPEPAAEPTPAPPPSPRVPPVADTHARAPSKPSKRKLGMVML